MNKFHQLILGLLLGVVGTLTFIYNANAQGMGVGQGGALFSLPNAPQIESGQVIFATGEVVITGNRLHDGVNKPVVEVGNTVINASDISIDAAGNLVTFVLPASTTDGTYAVTVETDDGFGTIDVTVGAAARPQIFNAFVDFSGNLVEVNGAGLHDGTTKPTVSIANILINTMDVIIDDNGNSLDFALPAINDGTYLLTVFTPTGPATFDLAVDSNSITSSNIDDGTVTPVDLSFDPATQAELETHKTSADHDGRYFTESELSTAGIVNSPTNPVDADLASETGLFR